MERTTKQVVDDTRDHLRQLVEAHIGLAKAEVAEAQAQLVAAIAPLAVAGIIALFLLGFFGVTAAKGIAAAGVEEWLAWLIVSGALTLLVAILALVGRSKLQKLDLAPAQSTDAVQQTVAWAKQRVKTVGD